MTIAQISILPLSALTLAEENARYGVTYDEDALRDLANSIRSPLGLLDPLKAYATETGAAVWDGGRRLAALGLIAADDAGAALLASVPVILTSREEARLASMATFVRKDMHPAERFLTYNRLFEDGQTAQQIAAACAVSERGVAQLLRFRMLASEIFAAFRDGGMDLDAAFAFTLTDVHDDQRAVLASFNGKPPQAHQVRDRLRKNSVHANNRQARYVGREAYAAAGGRFLTDLFSNREIDETWQDAALLDSLYEAKLAAKVAEIEAEGWGQVLVTDDHYGWQKGHDLGAPEGSGAKGKKVWSPEQLATGVAFLQFNYQGELKVLRGYFKPKSNAGGAGAAVPLSKREPGRYGFGHGGHEKLTLVATRATQLALIAHPQVAYDGVVQHLAWQMLNPAEDGVSRLGIPYDYKAPRPQEALAEAQDTWRDRLPADRAAFCDAVSALSPDDKAALLALSFAVTVNAVEPKTDYRKPARWEHLGWLARAAEVDFKAAWTPDEAFLKGGNREALEATVAEIAPRELAAMQKAKKGVLVAFTAQKVEQTGWVPQLLRELVEAPAKAKPKAARKAIVAAMAPEAAPEAPSAPTAH